MSPSSTGSLARTNYAFNLGDGVAGCDNSARDQDMVRGPFCTGSQFTLAAVTDGTSNTIMFGEISTVASTNNTNANGSPAVNPQLQGRNIGNMTPYTATGLTITTPDIGACKRSSRGGIYPTPGSTTTIFGNPSGTRWLDALVGLMGFQTILGPNSASCYVGTGFADVPNQNIHTAGSYHFGGTHGLLFDNAVKFIPNEIYTGNFYPISVPADYYAPGRNQNTSTRAFESTINWSSPTPFGTWGDMGTRGQGDEVGVMLGA